MTSLIEQATRPGVRGIRRRPILVDSVSDGVDTSSWLSPESVLDTARRGDVVVYSVEIGAARAPCMRHLRK